MARDVVTAVSPIDAYLGEVAHRWSGPRWRREQILAEPRDGLGLALDEQAPSDDTISRDIARFGPADAVARAFAGEQATAWARRTIAWYVATGPLIGVWWLLLPHAMPWRTGVVALMVAIAVFARSDLPVTPLGVVALTASLLRPASSVIVVHHAIAARRTMVAHHAPEDGDGRT